MRSAEAMRYSRNASSPGSTLRRTISLRRMMKALDELALRALLSSPGWSRYRCAMTSQALSDAEIQAIVARLRGGERIPHPNHLPLYADTRENRSELSAEGDGFLWTTYFNEYASGHGWSIEMTEERSLDEAALRAVLAG